MGHVEMGKAEGTLLKYNFLNWLEILHWKTIDKALAEVHKEPQHSIKHGEQIKK